MDAAAVGRDQAQAELSAAEQAQRAVAQRVRELRADLERAVRDQADAATAERHSLAKLDKAERRHRQAGRDLQQARDQRGRMDR